MARSRPLADRARQMGESRLLELRQRLPEGAPEVRVPVNTRAARAEVLEQPVEAVAPDQVVRRQEVLGAPLPGRLLDPRDVRELVRDELQPFGARHGADMVPAASARARTTSGRSIPGC
ncbi:MAG TPA: hypothetical protein VF010_14875 [Methylomirabilota bacterium]|nr:hypothetical protein [Methylomirabilota bacterium]